MHIMRDKKKEILVTNNEILRRIRYIFDFSDSKMTTIFGIADYMVTREQISNWLKKDDDPAYQECDNTQLVIFLNGMIIDKRGKKEKMCSQDFVLHPSRMMYK